MLRSDKRCFGSCYYWSEAKSRRLQQLVMNIWDFVLALAAWWAGLVLLQQGPWFKSQPLKEINERTSTTLNQLVQTKYFRIIRLNVNQECQLSTMNKICKSQSCTVCRCNHKDIPEFWTNTQKVKTHLHDLDLWEDERGISKNGWVWHVEDEANDKGEYFDIHTNIESFTNYNGSYIWKLVYEDNCFSNAYQRMCNEEKILYNIISGLHTSISTHLSKFYKYSSQQNLWADLTQDQDKFHFNHSQYNRRVLAHPERIRNLLFLYKILAKAITQAAPYLISNFTIASDDFAQDIQAKRLLGELLQKLQGYDLSDEEKEALKFFTPGNPMVRQYQKYIHNISNILNCVECEKCRLFGKMQTYGVGTALKILLGYPTPYKRNQIVALLNVFNKISMSVDTYYDSRKDVIALGYEQTNKDYIFYYKILAGFLCVIALWSRFRSQFYADPAPAKQQEENAKQD